VSCICCTIDLAEKMNSCSSLLGMRYEKAINSLDFTDVSIENINSLFLFCRDILDSIAISLEEF